MASYGEALSHQAGAFLEDPSFCYPSLYCNPNSLQMDNYPSRDMESEGQYQFSRTTRSSKTSNTQKYE